MNNIDILEELKEWFNNFDLDSIKHKPEEYIKAISNLIAENKELKEKKKKIIKKLKEDVELASTTVKWIDERTKQVVPSKTIIVNESDYAKTILKIMEE